MIDEKKLIEDLKCFFEKINYPFKNEIYEKGVINIVNKQEETEYDKGE